MNTPDFTVENHGTVWLFRTWSDQAREWVNFNIAVPSWAWIRGNGFVVAHRLGGSIVEGIRTDGLVVTPAGGGHA